jgi:hypothetical protein
MERFEKIRLARAVRARREYDTRLQRELESGVRAEVSEGDLADDQPISPPTVDRPALNRPAINQGAGSA